MTGAIAGVEIVALIIIRGPAEMTVEEISPLKGDNHNTRSRKEPFFVLCVWGSVGKGQTKVHGWCVCSVSVSMVPPKMLHASS